jgi:UDP-N-acetylmuramyl pentapeptide phosphotransferase/UDP-N-acetylglucosamine-1-phosphate transferase
MTLAAVLRHLAFAAGLAVLSAAVVRAMIAVRVMDRPDPRKVHTRDTPKGGGVGVVVAFLVGIAVLYRFAEFARLADPYFVGVIEASLAIAVVAFLDDMYDWKFTVKLAAQIMAAVVAVGSGIYIADYHVPYVGPLFIGWLAPPVTILWLLFATNAMNFIDGLNGLAGGVALIASGFLAAIAATHGGWFAYFAALLLAAGLAGFLPFNFPRARIFMGDVGSQFCGFVLAILAVVAGRFDNVELSFLIVPMLLSGVLFDVAFTLVRRALAGERLTEPHRGHLYQVAQRSGIAASSIAVIHWGFAAFGGVCALVFLAVPSGLKPYVPLLTLPLQLGWLWHVARSARQAGVARWG